MKSLIAFATAGTSAKAKPMAVLPTIISSGTGRPACFIAMAASVFFTTWNSPDDSRTLRRRVSMPFTGKPVYDVMMRASLFFNSSP